MATIVTRSGKGSPLTNAEVDGNFTNLNTELGTKANTSSLATVATSGAYSDLTGKPTNVSSFANDSGYITGITSGNVTTALGFTPYNATNPAGYITSSALSGYLPLSGGTLTGGVNVQGASFPTSGVGMELLWDGTQSVLQSYNRNIATYQPLRLDGSALQLFTNGTEKARIDTSGNVLINRTSTSGIGKLNVEGGADVTSGNVTIQAGYGIAWRGDQARIMTPEDNAYGALIRWGAGGGCRFFESTAERMRIDGTGSVTVNVDIRAPIFYDQSNTAYYVDLNNTSNINKLTASNRSMVGNASIFMSDLDANTYYPVTIPIPVARQTTLRIENALNSNAPSWSTHPSGFSCYIEWTTNGLGWGTIPISRRVTDWREQFATVQIVGGITQLGNGSTEVIWLRGGANYFFSADCDVTPTVRTTLYDLLGQTVEPRSTVFNDPWATAVGKMSYGTFQANERVTAATDIRAPIFYDSDNTAYYIDLTSSTSINAGGSILASGNLTLNNGANRYVRIGSATNYSYDLQTTGDDFQIIEAGVTPRLTIKYPNGNLGLNTATPAGRLSVASGSSAGAGTPAWSGNHSVFGPNAGSVTGAAIALGYNTSIDAAELFALAPAVAWKPLNIYSAGLNLYASSGGIGASLNGSGTFSAATDVRAPVFYDSADTAFYVDPASGTRLNSQLEVLGSRPFTYSASGGSLTIKGDAGGWATGTYFLGSAGTNRGGFGALGGGDGLSYLWAGNAYNDAALYIYSAGHTVANTSLRAPIFYDSNDTGYYIDPTSNATSMRTNGSWITNPTSTWGGEVAGKLEYHNNRWYASVNTAFVVRSTTGSEVFWAYNTGVVEAANDFRAPVFYDSNNTGYFLDASFTGTSLNIAGNGVAAGVFDSTGVSAHDVGINDPYGKIGVTRSTGANYAYYGLTRSGQVGMAIGIDTSNQFWVGGASGGYDGTRTNVYFQTNTSGDVTAASSFRAPIFYDSNDTGYYIDPASTSRINQINYTALYSASSSDYGIVGNNGYFDTVNSGVDADALELCYVRGSEVRIGTGGGNKAIRASIFYEGTNTAYYVDPDSNGIALRTVGYWVADTTGWAGDVDGKIQRHNNSWYFGASNNWIFRATSGAEPFIVYQSGVTVASGDMRAPIFYDSNNTAFYVDPATDTRLGGTLLVGPTGAGAYTRFGSGAGDTTHATVASSNGNLHIDSQAGYDLYLNWYTARPVWSEGNAHFPIYYDRNDSAYYLNPNGTGTSLNVAGNIECIARSAAWSEGYRVRVPSRATWGGIRFTRDDANSNGNWAIGFTGIDSTDDLTFWGNLSGGEGMRARLTHAGNFSVAGTLTAAGAAVTYSLQGNGNVGGTGSASWHPSGIYSAGYNWLYGGISAGGSDISSVNNYYGNAYYDSGDTSTYINPNGVSWIKGDINISRVATGGDNNTFGGLELREVSLVSNTQSAASYAPRVNFHWGNMAAATIYMDSAGSFVFGGQSDITNNRRSIFCNELYATGNVTAYYSDDRLKTRIGNIENALDIVSSLNGFRYVDNELAETFGYANNGTQLGVSAQEVQKHLPEIVRGAAFDVDHDNPDHGSKTGENYLTVDYSRMVPLLIEAIKELRNEVEMLKK